MTAHIQDPAVAAVLARTLGHPSPYPDEELMAVRALRVVGASSLDDLTACTGLEDLAVIGSDITTLTALSRMKRLRKLAVLACPVVDAAGLAGLDQLEDLRLDFTFIEDVAPVLALPSLRRARLLGNPWSEPSWDALSRHALPQAGRDAAVRPIVELGTECSSTLEVSRRLREFGLALCFGALDILRTVLVRPGRPRIAGLECDWTVASGSGAYPEDGEQLTTDSLFDTIRTARTAKGWNTGFDFESHREFGDREDALRWIADEADPGRRASLQRFIERFPAAVFFREDDAFHDMVGRHAGVALPASYRSARKILAGAIPERSADYRVDRFDGPSPTETWVSQQEVWYRPQLATYDADEAPVFRDAARVYPFSRWPVQGMSVLAVSLDGAGSGILEYGEEDMYDVVRRTRRPDLALYPVYASHADLLGHIIAFKLPDGVVIDAVAAPPNE